MRRIFSQLEESLDVQDTEKDYSSIKGDNNYLFDLAFRQLFLCAIRYFTSPAFISSKKNMNPIEQKISPVKRFLGFKLAELARKSGFAILTFDDEQKSSAERLLVDLLAGLPKDLFKFEKSDIIPQHLLVSFEEYIERSTVVASNDTPRFTGYDILPLTRRCGQSCFFPPEEDDESLHEDRLRMFLRKMKFPSSLVAGTDIAPFFVQVSIYNAFFKAVSLEDLHETPAPDFDDRGSSGSTF